MVYSEIKHPVPEGTYRCTQIRLLENKTKDDYHLFTILEKLEPDMQGYVLPAPVPNRSDFGDGKKDTFKVYWLQCDYEVTKNFLNTPQNNFTLNDGNCDFTLKFFNKDFTEEPCCGDYFVLPLCHEESDLFHELLPTRKGPAYVKTYLDKGRDVEKVVAQHEYLRKQIDQASEALFGLKLTEWPEHLGNIYMVWHHEEIRNLEIRSNDSPYGVFIQIETRQGHHKGGEIVIWDAHDAGSVVTNNCYHIEPDEREVFIKTNDYPHLFRVDYYDADGRLVAFNKSCTFISCIKSSFSLGVKEVVMVKQNEDGSETKSEPVMKYSKEQTSVIGKPIKNQHSYFALHKFDHDKEKLENSREFIFFDGNKEDTAQQENLDKAKEAVRDILNRAREVLYVCDPYFHDTDFEEYIHYIRSSEVKIRIINSKADVGVKGLKKLIPIIKGYNKGMNVEDYITCRVLKGEKSMLHDRFIMVDNQVWNMGSSFGEFGARACTLSKLSESAGKIVKGYVEEWWNGELTRSLYDYENVAEPKQCVVCETLKKLYKKLCS